MSMPSSSRVRCSSALAVAVAVAALSLASAACGSPAQGVPAPAAPVAAAAPARPSPQASPSPMATATAVAFHGPTFILIRAPDLTAGARLHFQGQGFAAGEQAAVSVEDPHGQPEATLDPVTISKDGNLDEVSVALPADVGRGDHVLHVTGTSSGRAARATFRVLYVTPTITLDTYSAKSNHTFGFSGSGFVPGEVVEVRLGGLGGSPLATFPSDAQGTVTAQNVPLPLIQAGDYLLYFVGQQSQTPVSMGFNIQGFSPWVVLDSYSVAPYTIMGFTGQDFAPSEEVEVYLGQRTGQPLLRLAAGANGQFAIKNAFTLPDSAHGDQQLLFVGHQTGAVITAKFVVLPFGPSLQLTNYAGRPGTAIAFVGDGWAHNETLHVSIGEGHQPITTFQADANGAFDAAGQFRLPIGTEAGGVPLTVRGETSQAEVTLWYQALELKPSAELTAYQGPPGTVVAFTGRSFAGGERVTVHLTDRGGPELASATASDDGTVENVGTYPIDGNWGDDIHFVLVGNDSHAEGATDFKIGNPTDKVAPPAANPGVKAATPVASPGVRTAPPVANPGDRAATSVASPGHDAAAPAANPGDGAAAPDPAAAGG